MVKEKKNKLREYVSLLVGSYKISSPKDDLSLSYKQKKGTAHVILNLGEIDLGNEEQVEEEINRMLLLATHN